MTILLYILGGISYTLTGLVVMGCTLSLCEIPPPEIIREETEYPVSSWVFIILLCLLWPLFILKIISSPKTWQTINKIYMSLIEVFFK